MKRRNMDTKAVKAVCLDSDADNTDHYGIQHHI